MNIDPDHWNACVEIVMRPLETLDSSQRVAALVFRYHGRVMNGGHTLHFDARPNSSNDELLSALKTIGAIRHAQILAEAIFLMKQVEEADEDDAEAEREHAAEMIEGDIDRRFYYTKPDINELLERFFVAHPESFPNPT